MMTADALPQQPQHQHNASSSSSKPSTTAALFDVYLRLRPSSTANASRFLDVEQPSASRAALAEGLLHPTHITIKPPTNDHRKRAVEKFAFTRVFEEDASQLALFEEVGMLPLIEGVLGGKERREGRDGLLATLGVTGSGKSHTILGTKSQRGITQMALDVLFRSTASQLIDNSSTTALYSLAQSDVSESQLYPAGAFLDAIYGDAQSEKGYGSRAQTPALVGDNFSSASSISHFDDEHGSGKQDTVWYPRLSDKLDNCHSEPLSTLSSPSKMFLNSSTVTSTSTTSFLSSPFRLLRSTVSRSAKTVAKTYSSHQKDASSFIMDTPRKPARNMPRPSALPQVPHVDATISPDPGAEYAIVVSMYEVYNDRIYDLLTASMGTAKVGVTKRRALLFKSTEQCPDRKVVAGLRKVICSTLEEALSVLETGLIERRVAGTGSNAVSSRSHGFFCVEVKKRQKSRQSRWKSSTLTIVDLAGSERARNAKTAGATLAEAGKINESLMYLGQCMQMQSDHQEGSKNIVPFRQCKLTELLFSNSFPSLHGNSYLHSTTHPRVPQKAIMIVTADPLGDFNATSQILRYSALAREVTIPRVPSVTSQILASGPAGSSSSSSSSSRPNSVTSGRHSPTVAMEEFEHAQQEILRLQEETDILRLQLSEETSRRRAAEASWRAAEEHMLEVEQEVRDDCYNEMENRLQAERRRWKGAWAEEADRNDERFDRKLDILSRSVHVHEDDEDNQEGGGDEKTSRLEMENERLKRKLEDLERELQGKSPTRKQRVLKARKWEADVVVGGSP